MRLISKDRDSIYSAVAIVRFVTTRQAKNCQMTLVKLFDTIQKKVNEVFEQCDGQADLSQIASIYDKYGFQNENGWEQEQSIVVVENDVVWPLPFGIRKSDVEDLLQAMEPQSIEFHDVQEDFEEWQMYPLPELSPVSSMEEEFDFEDFFEDDEYPGNPPKRIIH